MDEPNETTTVFDIDIEEQAPPARGEAGPAARQWLNGVLGGLDPTQSQRRWRPMYGGTLEDLSNAVRELGGDPAFIGDGDAVSVGFLTVGFVGPLHVRTKVTGESFLLAMAKTVEVWKRERERWMGEGGGPVTVW